MTSPDFAELKRVLTEFDEQGLFTYSGNKGTWMWQMMLDGAQYQHTKSSAIISELIDIIKSQSEKLVEVKNNWSPAQSKFIDCHDWSDECESVRTVLSETNTRLQKLREGVK